MFKKPLVLIVDDQPINLQLLSRKLERHGIETVTADNGIQCLEAVKSRPPDLILLDVMMPEMDGITTCQTLKSDPKTEMIPIIFITARTSKEGKIEGLDAGAADYLTKPIDLDETLARVRTQLRIQEMFHENIELQKRLGDARKAASIGAVTQGIAHNLNNLLGVVVGYLDLIKAGYDSKERLERSIRLMDNAVQRMVNIVRELSSMAGHEKVELIPVNVRQLLGGTIRRFRKENNILSPINWENQIPEGLEMRTNHELLEGAIIKVLVNGWESYPKTTPPNERVLHLKTSIRKERGEQLLFIEIADDGNGIDEDVAENLFDPFVTTKTAVGRGMGLTTARHDLRNVGGDIQLENRPAGGALATIKHPL